MHIIPFHSPHTLVRATWALRRQHTTPQQLPASLSMGHNQFSFVPSQHRCRIASVCIPLSLRLTFSEFCSFFSVTFSQSTAGWVFISHQVTLVKCCPGVCFLRPASHWPSSHLGPAASPHTTTSFNTPCPAFYPLPCSSEPAFLLPPSPEDRSLPYVSPSPDDSLRLLPASCLSLQKTVWSFFYRNASSPVEKPPCLLLSFQQPALLCLSLGSPPRPCARPGWRPLSPGAGAFSLIYYLPQILGCSTLPAACWCSLQMGTHPQPSQVDWSPIHPRAVASRVGRPTGPGRCLR